MTSPAVAAGQFGWSCLLGLLLGVWYGLLRPLRPRHTAWADGAFVLGAAWAWLYLGFGICGGDLRLGNCAGLALGAVAWETTLGKSLRWGGFSER